ncbi:MAG: sulfotransferase [Magnetococcales bacterium]|nr:sulfotransferase [Magnetococcales bacterium]
MLLLDGKNFDDCARNYLESLYRLIISENCDKIVFNNGFEPYNPGPALDMLAAHQIIVTRDPRDVYVSGLNFYNVGRENVNLMAFDNNGINKSFLATDDIALFVKRYRLYQEKVFKVSRSDIFHMNFEQLVAEPQLYTTRIFKFLNINPVRHTDPEQFLTHCRVQKMLAYGVDIQIRMKFGTLSPS